VEALQLLAELPDGLVQDGMERDAAFFRRVPLKR